jgi:hypothetical protein
VHKEAIPSLLSLKKFALSQPYVFPLLVFFKFLTFPLPIALALPSSTLHVPLSQRPIFRFETRLRVSETIFKAPSKLSTSVLNAVHGTRVSGPAWIAQVSDNDKKDRPSCHPVH